MAALLLAGCPPSDGEPSTEAPVAPNGFVFSSFGFQYRPAGGEEGQVDALDLDGVVSTAGAPTVSECAHDDLQDLDGQDGVDHRFLHMIDDFPGLQRGQIVDGVIHAAVRNGEMTMLLLVEGLDDPVNDDEVVLQLMSSLDSPLSGGDGSLLPGSTLSAHPDASFQSVEMTAAVVNGQILAGPFEANLDFNIQIVDDAMRLRRAFIRVDLDGAESMSGVLGGFWSLEDLDRIIVEPTTSNGNAAGFDRVQAEAAMAAYADGDPDPSDGDCTSISAAFEFAGVPAFIAR
jgi:hypothetical protein